MAEQLNKLGKVLVYDSDVNLVDRTPGGKGFQSVTLDVAGDHIGGALTGKRVHYVKSNGSITENGAALLAAYETAKNAPIEYFEIEPNATAFTLTSFSMADDWRNYFSVGEIRLILSDGQNTATFLVTATSVQYNSFFGRTYVYINNIVFESGVEFPFENAVGGIKGYNYFEQILVVAPGEYSIPDDFVLDSRVSIVSADGSPSIQISGENVAIRYTYNGSKEISLISGFNTKNSNVPFLFGNSTKSTTFKNIWGGERTFTTDTEGYYIGYMTFENCKANSFSFFGSIKGLTVEESKAYNNVTGCIFKNCSAYSIGQSPTNVFCVAVLRAYDCTFINCEVLRGSGAFGTYSKEINRCEFINCHGNDAAFLSYLPSDVTISFNTVDSCTATGTWSFGSGCAQLRSTSFVDCTAMGNYAFAWNTTGGNYNDTLFLNCRSLADDAFGTDGSTHPFLARAINCWANYSFGFQWGTNITMQLINCVKESGSYNSVSGSGKVVNCIANSSTVVNLP